MPKSGDQKVGARQSVVFSNTLLFVFAMVLLLFLFLLAGFYDGLFGLKYLQAGIEAIEALFPELAVLFEPTSGFL